MACIQPPINRNKSCWTFLGKTPVNRYSLRIWHEALTKGMGPPKSTLVNQWVHRSYLQEHGWGVNYRNVSCYITLESHNNLWKATRRLLLSLVGLLESGEYCTICRWDTVTCSECGWVRATETAGENQMIFSTTCFCDEMPKGPSWRGAL